MVALGVRDDRVVGLLVDAQHTSSLGAGRSPSRRTAIGSAS
jgi:hypothetical protein